MDCWNSELQQRREPDTISQIGKLRAGQSTTKRMRRLREARRKAEGHVIHLHGDLGPIGCGILLALGIGILFMIGLIDSFPCCGVAVLVLMSLGIFSLFVRS